MLIISRLINWAGFSGMFMTIFIYSSSVTSETCSMNPNYCTILFRSVLWFTVVIALAVIKSDRRGGRIDWAVAVILSIGISLLLWNHSVIFLFMFFLRGQSCGYIPDPFFCCSAFLEILPFCYIFFPPLNSLIFFQTPFVIRFYDEVDILIGGILAIISFIGFLLTNRRSVIASPILQVNINFVDIFESYSSSALVSEPCLS